MKTLGLADNEAALLSDILTSALSDIRMEIAHTDGSAFKEGLRERKEILEQLLDKVAEAGS